MNRKLKMIEGLSEVQSSVFEKMLWRRMLSIGFNPLDVTDRMLFIRRAVSHLLRSNFIFGGLVEENEELMRYTHKLLYALYPVKRGERNLQIPSFENCSSRVLPGVEALKYLVFMYNRNTIVPTAEEFYGRAIYLIARFDALVVSGSAEVDEDKFREVTGLCFDPLMRYEAMAGIWEEIPEDQCS